MTAETGPQGIEEIVVVCDNQSHTRGKIAHIETFSRSGVGWYPTRAINTLDRTGDASRHRRNMASIPEEDYLQGSGQRGRRLQYRCKLCGLDLQCNADKLVPFLDGLAEQGVSQTTLKALIRVVSIPT
jgi:hypothetical protein